MHWSLKPKALSPFQLIDFTPNAMKKGFSWRLSSSVHVIVSHVNHHVIQQELSWWKRLFRKNGFTTLPAPTQYQMNNAFPSFVSTMLFGCVSIRLKYSISPDEKRAIVWLTVAIIFPICTTQMITAAPTTNQPMGRHQRQRERKKRTTHTNTHRILANDVSENSLANETIYSAYFMCAKTHR